MNIMTKVGTHDNVVTYEHYCDTYDDLKNIPQEYITLGTVAVVLRDENNELGAYIANSNKEWLQLAATSSGSGSSSPVDLLQVLTTEDYDPETYIPTLSDPKTNIIYLVPAKEESTNNLFDEWIYTGENWEKFGGVSINGASVQGDWNQNDPSAPDYIKNRICYEENGVEVTLLSVETIDYYGAAAQVPQESLGDLTINDFDDTSIFEIIYDGETVFKGTLTDMSSEGAYYYVNSPDETFSAEDYSGEFIVLVKKTPGKILTIKKIYNKITKIDPKFLYAADWNQNDPADPEYIKNRICYEETRTNTIVEGNATKQFDTDTNTYKISLTDPTTSALDYLSTNGAYIYKFIYDNQTAYEGTLTVGYKEDSNNTIWMDPNNTTVCININSNGEMIETYLAVPSDSQSNVPDSGILTVIRIENYIQQIDSKFIPRPQYVYPDWNQSNSDAEGYIWNKPKIKQETNGGIIEGGATSAKGMRSHAEGHLTNANGNCSHAEGYNTVTSGQYSHAEGYYTNADYDTQHVSGKYNSTLSSAAVIVGNGTANTSRSNAYALDWNGNGYYQGDVYVNCSANSAPGNKLLTEKSFFSILSKISPLTVPKTYTLIIDQDNLNCETACTYAGDAVGMTKGSSVWDTMSIFNGIRPCVFNNGEVVYYLNPNDWNQKEDGTASVLTGEDGDVMIEIPKFAYRIYTDENNKIYVTISNDSKVIESDERFTYDAFSRLSEGDLDKIYIGAYEGYIDSENKLLHSIAGVWPTDQKTISECRTAAHSKGAHYQQFTYAQLKAIQCLYLIKYGNRNGQSAVGYGIYNDISKTSSSHSIRIFGIENFWGNYSQWVDGFYAVQDELNPDEILITTSWNEFTNEGIESTYTAEVSVPKGSGTPKYMIGQTEIGFIRKDSLGSSTTGWADRQHINSQSGGYIIGGSISISGSPNVSAGPFYLARSGSNVGLRVSARLTYV